jgi:hypothetical protein
MEVEPVVTTKGCRVRKPWLGGDVRCYNVSHLVGSLLESGGPEVLPVSHRSIIVPVSVEENRVLTAFVC